METFSALLAICAGNSPVKGQWRGALMFSLICVWINGWVNNREAGDLRRYRVHYNVTVMFVAGCPGDCHSDHFWCSWRRRLRRDRHAFVSVNNLCGFDEFAHVVTWLFTLILCSYCDITDWFILIYFISLYFILNITLINIILTVCFIY